MNRIGRLRSEPEFWLGSNGSDFIRQSMVANATPAMLRKVTRQPSASPTTRPSGIPRTIANVVPVASRPKALACWPGGATRTASDAVMAQNTAWDMAMPMRLTSNMAKLCDSHDNRWLTMNTRNTNSNRRRRSTLRVSSIIGSDARATTQA
ncbi:hypothetical protein D3C71_1660500 [compost metagenome]